MPTSAVCSAMIEPPTESPSTIETVLAASRIRTRGLAKKTQETNQRGEAGLPHQAVRPVAPPPRGLSLARPVPSVHVQQVPNPAQILHLVPEYFPSGWCVYAVSQIHSNIQQQPLPDGLRTEPRALASGCRSRPHLPLWTRACTNHREGAKRCCGQFA